jgi:hypothetical protein
VKLAVELSAQGRMQVCEADDLGAGGCRVQLLFPLARGTMVRVRLRAERVPFELAGTATIAWATRDPPYRAGVAFSSHMEEDGARFVQALLGPVAILSPGRT